MKRIFIFFVLGLVWIASVSAVTIDDMEQFRANNPDGRKYEFVKNFIRGLSYMKSVEERSVLWTDLSQEDLEDETFIKELAQSLKDDATDLRVAKNLVERFRTPENGLILKTTDMFQGLCEELVLVNELESALLARRDFKGYIQAKPEMISRRKQAMQKLLETAFMVNKVLISPETNYYGRLDTLGITSKQRKKLLNRLDDFYGEGYKGELREGQTFLQGSISVIREVLEDYSWDTLDS